jgi:Fe-S cluster biogenesis protein NfuA
MNTTTTIKNEDVLVRVQETPNPFALKFIVNLALKTEGKATFQTLKSAENFPLVRDLFAIEGVRQVYLFQNTLTITHDGSLSEQDLGDQVTAVLKTRLPVHNPDFTVGDEAPVVKKVDRSHLDEKRKKVEEILDRTIRPGLQADGGDIDVISFDNNELKILYQGACGGCPSSMMGTLEAIQNILRNELDNPEIVVSPL